MSYSVDIKGLRELQLKMEQLPALLQKEVKGVMEAGCQLFVRNAQRDAPVDFGFLKLGISYAFVLADKTHTTFELVSNAAYSPYLEWGTITHVSVPSAEAGYAIQFKGKGIRKTGGVYPRPYFFKQLPATITYIETKLAAIIKEVNL